MDLVNFFLSKITLNLLENVLRIQRRSTWLRTEVQRLLTGSCSWRWHWKIGICRRLHRWACCPIGRCRRWDLLLKVLEKRWERDASKLKSVDNEIVVSTLTLNFIWLRNPILTWIEKRVHLRLKSLECRDLCGRHRFQGRHIGISGKCLQESLQIFLAELGRQRRLISFVVPFGGCVWAGTRIVWFDDLWRIRKIVGIFKKF